RADARDAERALGAEHLLVGRRVPEGGARQRAGRLPRREGGGAYAGRRRGLELTAATGAPPLPNALARWPEIAHRIAASRLALFLDYDGTLSPIAPRPDLATLPEATRDVLVRLAAHHPVAILSGRGRDDVAALVDLPQLTYAGRHGFDIRGPGLEHEVGEGIPATIARVAAELAAELGAIDGVLVEPKRFSVAVHYRLVRPAEVPAIEAAVARAAERTGLRQVGGKKVFELRPDIDWHKGEALLWLLDRLAPASRGE